MQPVADIYQQLDAFCRETDYAGWDPFDGLNSRLLQLSALDRSRWLRLAWLQLFKRSPVNLRPLSGTPKVKNAKASAMLLRSYLLQQDESGARQCHNDLMRLRSDMSEWGAAAWGYPFDWQAKAFFVAKGTPNVICTAYALRALLHYWTSRGGVDAAIIQAGAHMVERHLLCEQNGQRYIGYIPGATALVYNANLWGAWLLVLAYIHGGPERYRLLAEDAIATALSAQQPDGSWHYGTLAHHRFIDGFHTGYNLESLSLMQAHLGSEAMDDAISRGLAFYRQHCFSGEGRAYYYADDARLLDPHNAAQGILTLNYLNPPGARAQAEAIMHYAIRQCWLPERQHFLYQRRRGRFTTRIAYLRWTQAWMHLALSHVMAWEAAQAAYASLAYLSASPLSSHSAHMEE